MEFTMTDTVCTELTALAKATLFPALYLVFFAWSVTLLGA
jgi:hypothetical protein